MKLIPMPHQARGTQICLSQRATLLAFEMGTGKTLTAINCIDPNKTTLILCPASLQNNWRAELEISGIDLTKVTIKSYNKVDWLESPDLLILDESHYLKNPSSARSINTRAVARNAKRIVALTGTPIVNRLEELAVQMEMLGVSKEFSSNLNYLYENNILIRVRTQDVLDIPEPKFNDTYIELANTEEIIAIQQEIRQIYTDSDSNFEQMWADYSMILVGKLMKIRKHVGISKVAEAIRLIQQQLDDEPEEPIIVFGHHKQVLEAVADAFNCPLLYGKTSQKKRHRYVQEFQEGKHKVIACSIIAASVGITLTRSHKIMFTELPWTNSDYDQAVARSWRKGQEEVTEVTNILSTHRVDQRHLQILETKKKIVSCLDGGNPSKEDSTEKLLIKDIIEN